MRRDRNIKINLLVLLLFVLLSVLMLWPLPKHMSDTLISEVDPLLNTWILSWDVHQLFKEPFHLFDANIFYPLKNTLAFSEHLIVLSLIAMPVSLISGNPILGYNFVQLIAFILCGFTAYLLVYHLTGNRIAAIIAGIIFTFHPFRFRQVGHIQNITVFWTPLSFLYLHKFITKPCWKYVLMFALFFVLQALSCGYLGVFLAIAVIMFVLYYLLFMSRTHIVPFIKKLVASGVLSAILIAPFLFPYFQVKKEHGFERSIESNIRFSANVLGYVTVSRFNENVFYQSLSLRNRIAIVRTHEGKLRPIGHGLFPGIITLLLALSGFLIPPYAPKSYLRTKTPRRKLFQTAERIVNSLLLFLFIVVGAIIFSRGIEISVASIKISLIHLTNPVFFMIFFFIVKLVLRRFTLDNVEDENNKSIIHRNFYLFLGFFALILSLGPRIFLITHDFGSGLYSVLYKKILFFRGIRVPERFGILVMLALTILVGFGMAKLLNLFKKRGKVVLSCLVSAFLIYEFICVPLPYTKISREPKDVYRWLSSDKEQYGILEYPFETLQQDKYYMYWSTFHWKKLANGSSGFNPELIGRLRRLAHEKETFPNQEFIHYLKTLVPVKYLILHLGDKDEKEREDILDNVSLFSEDLKLVKTFDGNDYVFEVIYDNEVMTSY